MRGSVVFNDIIHGTHVIAWKSKDRNQFIARAQRVGEHDHRYSTWTSPLQQAVDFALSSLELARGRGWRKDVDPIENQIDVLEGLVQLRNQGKVDDLVHVDMVISIYSAFEETA